MDLYNEPLNLSVRTKPVAVVPPSSNKNYDYEASNTPSYVAESPDDSSDAQNVENKKTGGSSQNLAIIINNNNNNISISTNSDGSAVAVHNEGDATPSNYSCSNDNSVASLNHPAAATVDVESGDETSSRNPTSLLHRTAISTLLAAYMSNFHEHQQSLDAAKLHLQQYLKLTNQYLQRYAELVPAAEQVSLGAGGGGAGGGGSSSNSSSDTINNIIHTNILTNKITTNNLISIINKLLEQNIVSEFYFKHATAFQEQHQLRQDFNSSVSDDLEDYEERILASVDRSDASNHTNNSLLSDNNLMSSVLSTCGAGGSMKSTTTNNSFMAHGHATSLKTMQNLAMFARER